MFIKYKGTPQEHFDRYMLIVLLKRIPCDILKKIIRMARTLCADDQICHFAQIHDIDSMSLAAILRRYKDAKVMGIFK